MKKSLLSLCLLAPVALGLQVPQQPEPKTEPVRAVVGEPAPAFRLNDETGALTAFGGAAKTWTALAFYPKAMTGG